MHTFVHTDDDDDDDDDDEEEEEVDDNDNENYGVYTLIHSMPAMTRPSPIPMLRFIRSRSH